MSIVAPKDTLQYQLKGRPLSLHRDMFQTPTPVVAKALRQFMMQDKEGNTKPETDALAFYTLNHAVALLRNRFDWMEPLGDLADVAALYNDLCASRAVRAFYYLLLITTRENRHLKNKTGLKASIVSTYGQAAYDFVQKCPDQAGAAVSMFTQSPPDCTIGDWVMTLRHCFYKGSWSGGYGGPKWGQVTDCLVEYVFGGFSAEMMLDTVWTLCHNGGPIFNKGMLYTTYSGELKRILDVQRSGQIPMYIEEGLAIPFMTDSIKTAHNVCKERLGADYVGAGKVDWLLVEKLGALGKYTKKLAKAPVSKVMIAKMEAKVALNKEMTAQIAKYGAVSIMPGVVVPKAPSPRVEENAK